MKIIRLILVHIGETADSITIDDLVITIASIVAIMAIGSRRRVFRHHSIVETRCITHPGEQIANMEKLMQNVEGR